MGDKAIWAIGFTPTANDFFLATDGEVLHMCARGAYPLIRVHPDGKIYVLGELVEDDGPVARALVEWVRNSGVLSSR